MLKTYARALRICAVLLFIVAAVAVEFPSVKAQSVETRQNTDVKSSAADTLTAQERSDVFEYVWKTIEEKYYDPAFNGTDWQAVRERYRPRLEATAGVEEFYALLSQMTGELRDAHTRVRSPRQNEERKRQQATSAGVRLYEVEGTPVVFSVTVDSEAARAGVAAGMVVRTVDGRDVSEALAGARRDVGASSSERAVRLLSYSRLIAGAPDTPLKLGLTRADGTPFDVTLMRRTINVPAQVTSRLLPSGYAYLKLNRFLPPAARQMKDALQKFKDAPGLILDLRANGGGDGAEGMKLGGYFFNDKVPIARIVTRTGKPPSAFFGLMSLPKEFQAGRKGGQLYANPIVVLINEATGSTSELFASAMQEQGRAAIIGTQSCGCVLGVLKHRELKGGGELDISEIGFVTAKGRTLEGHGVTPDRATVVTLADLQQQHDSTLDEAEKYLNELLKRNAKSDLLP